MNTKNLTARYEEALNRSELAAKAKDYYVARQYRQEAARISKKISEAEGSVESWE